MKFLKKNSHKLVLLFYVFILPVSVLYARGQSPTGIKNPIAPIDSIPGLIHKILDGLIMIGMPVIALAIVYSGFLFVFARGNPEKLKKAKDALLWTVVGGAVLLGSWAIAKMISATITGL